MDIVGSCLPCLPSVKVRGPASVSVEEAGTLNVFAAGAVRVEIRQRGNVEEFDMSALDAGRGSTASISAL